MSGPRIGILDDYQDVALSLADWSSLSAQIEVFTAPFADADEVVERLADFDVLVAMRERTRGRCSSGTMSHGKEPVRAGLP